MYTVGSGKNRGKNSFHFWSFQQFLNGLKTFCVRGKCNKNKEVIRHSFIRAYTWVYVRTIIYSTVEELLFFFPFCDSNELIKSSIVTGDGLPVFVRYIHWIQWSLRARLLRYSFSLSKSSRLIFRSCLDSGNNKKTGRNSLEWKERLQGTRSKTQSK